MRWNHAETDRLYHSDMALDTLWNPTDCGAVDSGGIPLVGRFVADKPQGVDNISKITYTKNMMTHVTEQKMRKLLGVLGVGFAFIGMAGIAGGITEAGPDFGLNEALNLFSLALVTGAMFNISMMMLEDE